jgi:hypothetical protein
VAAINDRNGLRMGDLGKCLLNSFNCVGADIRRVITWWFQERTCFNNADSLYLDNLFASRWLQVASLVMADATNRPPG